MIGLVIELIEFMFNVFKFFVWLVVWFFESEDEFKDVYSIVLIIVFIIEGNLGIILFV